MRPILQLTGTSEFNEVFFDDARTAGRPGGRRARRRLADRDGAPSASNAASPRSASRSASAASSTTSSPRPSGPARYDDPLLRDRPHPGPDRAARCCARTRCGRWAAAAGPEVAVGKLLWAQWHRGLGELAMRCSRRAVAGRRDGAELDDVAAAAPVQPRRHDLRRLRRDRSAPSSPSACSACPGRHDRDPPVPARPRPAGRQGRGGHRRGRHRHRLGGGAPVSRRGRERRHQRLARAAARREGGRTGRAGQGARDPLRRHRRGPGPGADRRRGGPLRPDRRDGQQRRAGRHEVGAGHDRRGVVTRAGHHAHRHVPLHPGGAAAVRRPGRRRGDRQQRVGDRLAGAGRSGALRRREGRRDGADPLLRAGRRRARHPDQRGRAEPRHASRSWPR